MFCTFSKKDRDVYERLAPEYFETAEDEAGGQAGDAAASADAAAAGEKEEQAEEGVTTRAQAQALAERRSASPQQERAETRD